MRAALAIVSAVLLLTGCVSREVCGCNEYVPRFPTDHFDVAVTEKDHAVTVRTGQKIEVVLQTSAGMTAWSGVTADNTAVLSAVPVPAPVRAISGKTIAGFEAVAPGTATIRATATPLCSPGQACPQFAMEYEVVVTVT